MDGRRVFFLFKIFEHLGLESLDMPQSLQPVGCILVVMIVGFLAEDVGREVAVQSHLADLPGEVWVGDGPGRGEMSQLRLQLRLADHTDPVALEVQRLD